MNINIAELKQYVENGYTINFTFKTHRLSIRYSESEEEIIEISGYENHRWMVLNEYSSFEALSDSFILMDSSFETIWRESTDILIDKLDLATLIRTIRFGELEFRVRHKRYFAEGSSWGYYCISFDEKDEDGDTICYEFDEKPRAKSFDMFLNARIFDGMTFAEAYPEMTIIKGVFY